MEQKSVISRRLVGAVRGVTSNGRFVRRLAAVAIPSGVARGQAVGLGDGLADELGEGFARELAVDRGRAQLHPVRGVMRWFGRPSNWDASTDLGDVLAWCEAVNERCLIPRCLTWSTWEASD